MTRYAFTGPSRLRPGESLRISETVYRLAAPTEILTGCADGADTLVALLGAAFWPAVPQRLFVPAAPSNVDAVIRALDALGVDSAIEGMGPRPARAVTTRRRTAPGTRRWSARARSSSRSSARRSSTARASG